VSLELLALWILVSSNNAN